MVHVFWNRMHNDHSRLCKVIDFSTNWKHLQNFPLLLNSNVGHILRLHSANRHQLTVSCCLLNTFGRRAFLIAGPKVWNSLPDELRDPACGSDSFKQFLKTIQSSLY